MKIAVLFSLLVAGVTSASMCPKTFNDINVGATQDEVRTACGAPDSIKKSEAEKEKQYPVMRFYFTFPILDPTQPKPPALMFEVSDNKITAITANGSPIQSTSVCGGLISVKDPAGVISQCGNPLYSDQGVNTEKTGTKKVETWFYQGQAYQPNQIFTFEDGILTSVQKQ
jgi:hypothetical protein